MSLSLLTAAAEAPRRVALVISGEEYTYAELAARVRLILPDVARRAADAAWVALVGTTDLATLEQLYALMELGRPVLLLHPRWSQREQDEMVEACASSQTKGEPMISGAVGEERILAIVPTSGSSGRPKGVMLSRRAFLASARASECNLGWRDEDRWLLSLPIAHVGGLSILTRSLIARRTVVVHQGPRFEASDVAEVVRLQRITLLSVVPTTLRRLLKIEPRWDPPQWLRAILVGGAAASETLLASAADRGWPVLTTYGLTEACSQVTTQPLGSVQRGEMGCGPSLAGTEVRISGGVIEVRGPQLMTGYLPAHLGFTEDGWLRTEDLGHLDRDGNLHVLGRLDDVIVSGGENVRAMEVEQVLEDHPAIAAACVFGVDDEEWGQVVVAALVSSEPASAEPALVDELDAYLRARLAGFKRPRRFVYLTKFSRLPSGKVDRKETVRRARSLRDNFLSL